MSGSLSKENDQTIWVVAKLGIEVYNSDDYHTAVVEEQAYWDKKLAEKRAEHLKSQDGVEASVWPVRFWAPISAYSDNVPLPTNPIWLPGVSTYGRGQELHDYGGPSRPLARIVDETWLAWRQQQATLGNLDEAGQDGPSVSQLQVLYSEEPTPVQLSLPFPDQAEPAHS